MQINWSLKKFEHLTPYELYDILRLRSDVFVVEQNCVFLDQDNKDQECFHYTGYIDNQLAAYVRIVPAGVSYKEASIGRVVTSPLFRRNGLGRILMMNSISVTRELFGNQSIKIGAQLYLQKFYSSLGFVNCSDVYVEDGIEHIEMILDA